MFVLAFIVIPAGMLGAVWTLLISILKRDDPDWLIRPRWKNWPNLPW